MGHATDFETKPVDPVCGMSVATTAKDIRFDYEGRTFHFCAETCREAFKANPRKYAKANKKRHLGPLHGPAPESHRRQGHEVLQIKHPAEF